MSSLLSATAASPEAICPTLAESDLCLPCSLARTEPKPPGLTLRRRRVERHATLFRQGDAFHAIYAVRAGSLKTVLQAADGLEQLTAFALPGEILGLDGLARGCHASTATALEDSEIVVLPYEDTSWWPGPAAALHHLISRLLSREMVKCHARLQLLAQRSAETRVATLLLDLSQRLQARGYSPSEFHLRLSRQEIGSYLGVKLETVSRVLASLQQQRVLAVDGKHVRLFDLPGLERLAASCVE